MSAVSIRVVCWWLTQPQSSTAPVFAGKDSMHGFLHTNTSSEEIVVASFMQGEGAQ